MRAQPNPGGEAPSTATSGLHILAGLRIAIGDLVALEAGVVGEWAPPSGGPSRAFVYADGVMADLNNLIPGGSGWDLASAKLINDAGQIAGQGVLAGEYPAFLLTPLTPTRDHYKCYRTRSLSHFAPRSVPLVDEFGTSDSSVLRPAHLCNPADEDGGGSAIRRRTSCATRSGTRRPSRAAACSFAISSATRH